MAEHRGVISVPPWSRCRFSLGQVTVQSFRGALARDRHEPGHLGRLPAAQGLSAPHRAVSDVSFGVGFQRQNSADHRECEDPGQTRRHRCGNPHVGVDEGDRPVGAESLNCDTDHDRSRNPSQPGTEARRNDDRKAGSCDRKICARVRYPSRQAGSLPLTLQGTSARRARTPPVTQVDPPWGTSEGSESDSRQSRGRSLVMRRRTRHYLSDPQFAPSDNTKRSQ